MGDLFEAGVGTQVKNVVPSIHEPAFGAIDISDLAFAGDGSFKTWGQQRKKRATQPAE